ncbi:MAG: chemotaxis protein CheX [Myxococcales bacterium]|nr:chemotaxis protein CheX [Myxococcales bacterium]MCB9731846.1 chemotaxis protein CheX [Deltaproteobacteria bacterium]
MDLSDDLADIVLALGEDTLGIWLARRAFDVAALDRDHAVTASVDIAGAHPSTLFVSCSEPLARVISARMFGGAEDDATVGELADALAEVANIVGGNVKAMLEPPTTLALPEPVPGGLPLDAVARARGVAGFRCNDEHLLVMVADRS